MTTKCSTEHITKHTPWSNLPTHASKPIISGNVLWFTNGEGEGEYRLMYVPYNLDYGDFLHRHFYPGTVDSVDILNYELNRGVLFNHSVFFVGVVQRVKVIAYDALSPVWVPGYTRNDVALMSVNEMTDLYYRMMESA